MKINGKRVISAGVILSLLSFSAIGAVGDNRAKIKSLKKRVEIKYGNSLWRKARVNQMVRPNTKIRTGALSRAELSYNDGSITRIGSRSQVNVLSKDKRSVRIAKGRMWFKVNKKSKKGLKIFAPGAVAAITGTEGIAEITSTDNEKQSKFPLLFASSDLSKFPFKISQAGGVQFNVGLVNGTAMMFKTDNSGNTIGDPITISPGTIVSFSNDLFSIQNIDPETLKNKFSDISQKDQVAKNNNNNSNQSNNNNNNGNKENNNNNNNQNQSNNNPVGNQNNNNNPVGNQNSNNQTNTNNQNVKGSELGQTNATENVPNLPNQVQNQNIENSPTTGDLEIIIK